MKGSRDHKSVVLGTAQRDRYLRALMPQNIYVDARELHDFLSFCTRAARLIQHVNASNEAEGTWADALEKDPAVFLASVMEYKPGHWDNDIREIVQKFYNASDEGRLTTCEVLVDKTIELAALLDSWYSNSIALRKWGEESPVTPVIEKAIETGLNKGLQHLRDLLHSRQAKKIFKNRLKWNRLLDTFHPIWGLDAARADFPFAGFDVEKWRDVAVEELRQFIQQLQSPMTYVSLRAPVWFQELLDKKNDHDPHVGLLLSFLQLFLHARDQMNTLPEKHLHHYYFDLLQQKMKPHVPDHAVVSFQLFESADPMLLPKNTKLLAGINDKGLESHYATLEDVVLTSAQIASLRTTYVSKSGMMKADSSYKLVSGIYAASVANSRDGAGAPFNNDQTSWPTFGEEQLDRNLSERQMFNAQLGFVIAAPILSLQEGEREIKLAFHFTEASLAILVDLIDDIAQNRQQSKEDATIRLFANALLIYASGEAGWFPIESWKTDTPSTWMETGILTISLQLSSEDDALRDNNPEVLGESYDSPWPLLKIVLNPDDDIYLYSFWAHLELEALEVNVQVKGMKSLTLINEVGLIDNSAPFMPFGAVPNRNAYMLIGSLELFRKRLTDLKIQIEWNNIPDLEGGFAEYYKQYNPEINNDSFQVQISALSNNNFRPHQPEQREVFPLFAADSPTEKLHSSSTIEHIQLKLLQMQPDYHSKLLLEYNNSLRAGYFKMQLCRLPMAFGHSDYPRLFSKAMVDQTRTTAGFLGLGGEPPAEFTLPREPYVPIIEKLTLDYTATTIFNLTSERLAESDQQAGEKIIALHPFGKMEVFAGGKAFTNKLFAEFESDGYLYIGLSGVQPGNPVQLLFNIRESKFPARHNTLKVRWSYLQSNHWEYFPEEALLFDKTRQFTTTGIVSLSIPTEINTDHSIMPTGLFWLRAAAKGSLEIVGRVLDVQVNAVEVRWIDNGDPAHFDQNAPLSPIVELVQPQPEIASVKQATGFYGALAAEELPAFYVHTSERLRHKNRAVSSWDVERLVLASFPQIRRVKCIGPMEYDRLPPGQTKVIVVPQTTEAELEPVVGFYQLEQITKFLQDRTSAFSSFKVINPVYEKVKVTARIALQAGLEQEKGKYLQRLHHDLLHFICPWLRGDNIVFGGSLSKNDMLAFIKDRPYVRFITSFSMIQIYESDTDELVILDTAGPTAHSETLVASTPWSILTPVAQHNIQFSNTIDNISPAKTAIEDMRLETDFIVQGSDTGGSNGSGLTTYESQESDETPSGWYLFPKNPS